MDWLLKAARRVGIDLSSAAQDLDAESGGRTAANELTLENYFKLLSMAEMLSGDSDIGLHIGEVVDLSELGVYGHVLLYAATVDEFLHLIEKHEPLLAGALVPRIVPGEHITRLEHHVLNAPQHPVTQDIALTLSGYTTAIRGYVGGQWHPVRSGFEFSKPARMSEYLRIFGPNVVFDQAASFIEIQNELLQLKIREIEPDLLGLLKDYVNELIIQSPKFPRTSERAKAVLAASIGKEGVSQEAVARRLYMSRASLQRHLADEGTSFRRLREQVVYDLARQTLINSESSINDIALMLGYSDASAFGRAFKQLSGGLTPLQFRHEPGLAS